MGSFSPFFFRRNQALSPTPNAEEEITPPPIMPDVDPIETLLEQSLLNTPPGEQAQRDLPIPNQADYNPSTGRKILSVIASALGGYSEGAAAGIGMGRAVLDSPYKNAMARYTEKAKALGNIAGLEEKELGRKRLGWGSILDRRERKRAEEERNKDRDLQRDKLKAGRSYKPEVRYDETGYATGEMLVFDGDAPRVVEVPGLKGHRRSAESPTMTQKKSANTVAMGKAQELLNTFDDLETKYKDVPIIGNPHVGPGQGAISDWLSGMGATDDNVRNLHMLTAELANERLYALSGAQINNKEYERLRRTMASTNKSSAAFRADLVRFMKFQKAAADGLISENDVDWTPEGATPTPSSTPNPTSSPTPGAAPPKRKYTIERM